MSYDFIGPKNDVAVYVESSVITPVVSSYTTTATLTPTFTMTMSSSQVGKIVTVAVDACSFTGNNNLIQTLAIGLPPPLHVYFFIIINNINGTKTECTAYFDTNRRLNFSSAMNSTTFSANPHTIYPFVFRYTTA